MDITILLARLADFSDPNTKTIMLSQLDMRSKIQALRTLGFAKKISHDWFTELEDTINEIDNEIRTERNRLIHDFWTTIPVKDAQEIHLLRINPKLEKPQSRTRALTLSDLKPVKSEDIANLCAKTINASVKISTIDYHYAESLPTPSPYRHL